MSPVFPEWFRMRSLFNGYVVTIDRSLIDNPSELLRSQVYLCPAQNDAYELWQWDGQYLKNKATKLVLDIRKGTEKSVPHYRSYFSCTSVYLPPA